MRIVFISNYLNHHQIPFSNAMYRELNGKYHFIQTESMERERIDLGWKFDDEQYPYLLKTYDNMDKCMEYINESDLVIIGSASDEFIKERVKERKLIFRYSERIYKKGQWRAISPRGIYYMNKAHAQSKRKNMYILCASAYTACDLSLFGFYKNRMIKWGYFPESYKINVNDLFAKKEKDRIEILWCGRFITWKHPEMVIQLAQYLKEKKYENVHITMIGSGILRINYEEEIKKRQISNIIEITGPFTPQEVRSKMMYANIFIATSDYSEGWGAVINEAMNSACTVVASHSMGSVPYLIQHKKNGLVYKGKNQRDFIKQVEYAINNPDFAKKMAIRAYETIDKVWNADNAAKTLIAFTKGIINKKVHYSEDGPCSKAPVISQWAMYRRVIKGQDI